MRTRSINIILLVLSCTILRASTLITDQTVGSLSGGMTAGGLKAESFVGLPFVSVSSTGSTTESVVFPVVAAEIQALKRVPLYVQLDKEIIQPKDAVSAKCVLDLAGSGLSMGGYACLMTWDTTAIKYTGHSASKTGKFTKPQVNDKLVQQGQLVFSEVAAEGDTGRIELLNVSFQSLEIEDSARCPIGLNLLSISTARTFQNLSSLVDVSPASLLIKKVEIDSVPPVIKGLEAFGYTYDTKGPYTIKAKVEDPILSRVLLNYRKSGTQTYSAVTMSENGEYYSGMIPGQPAGTTIEYYIEAADTMGNISRAPADYLTTPYTFQVVLRQQPYTDANNDGKENLLDVLSLLLLARKNPNDPRLDWNGDGRYTLADAAMMMDEIIRRSSLSGATMLASVGETGIISALELTSQESEYLRLMLSQLEMPDAVEASFDAILGGTRATLPKAFSLAQNYPNPFNPSTVIAYSIPAGCQDRVNLSIYDIRGRLVRHLVQSSASPGNFNVIWDGQDARGMTMPSGVYLYRLSAGDYTQIRKMIILK